MGGLTRKNLADAARELALYQKVRDQSSAIAHRFYETGRNTPRAAQLTAAITVPFVFTGLAVFAQVIKDTVYEALPEGAPVTVAVFFLGAALVAGTIAATIAWVRTGGFGLFV